MKVYDLGILAPLQHKDGIFRVSLIKRTLHQEREAREIFGGSYQA